MRVLFLTPGLVLIQPWTCAVKGLGSHVCVCVCECMFLGGVKMHCKFVHAAIYACFLPLHTAWILSWTWIFIWTLRAKVPHETVLRVTKPHMLPHRDLLTLKRNQISSAKWKHISKSTVNCPFALNGAVKSPAFWPYMQACVVGWVWQRKGIWVCLLLITINQVQNFSSVRTAVMTGFRVYMRHTHTHKVAVC